MNSCFLCKQPIKEEDMKEKTWYDNHGNVWHLKCGLKDGRLT